MVSKKKAKRGRESNSEVGDSEGPFGTKLLCQCSDPLDLAIELGRVCGRSNGLTSAL